MSDKILQQAIATWGETAQMDMVQEECAELITAIAHYKRGRIAEYDLIDECADAIIMTRQLRLILGVDEVDERITQKLDRLQIRMEIAAKGEDGK